jgi:hypothetical protein
VFACTAGVPGVADQVGDPNARDVVRGPGEVIR